MSHGLTVEESVTESQVQLLKQEIEELRAYLDAIPTKLRQSRAFSSYESRLEALRTQLANAQDSRTSPAPARPANQVTEVVLDESGAHAAYANFARVTATPEEVIVDFALNSQPFAVGRQDVKVSQRLIMNFFTAKRLLGALQMTMQRHESAFGTMELDVRRRANMPSPTASR